MLRHCGILVGAVALVLAGCGGGGASLEAADLDFVRPVPQMPPGLQRVEAVPLDAAFFAARERVTPAEVEDAGFRAARVAQFQSGDGFSYAEALAVLYDDAEAGLELARAHLPANGQRVLAAPELGEEAWADELRDVPRNEPLVEVMYRVAWRRGDAVIRVTIAGPRGLATLAAARAHAERLDAALPGAD